MAVSQDLLAILACDVTALIDQTATPRMITEMISVKARTLPDCERRPSLESLVYVRVSMAISPLPESDRPCR